MSNMRLILVLAVGLVAIVAAEETLNQKLLRALRVLEEKKREYETERRQVQSTSTVTPEVTTPESTASTAYQSTPLSDAQNYTYNYHSGPGEISFTEFKDTIEGWGAASHQFIHNVNLVKPMILGTLTRTEDWETVALRFNDILEHGEVLYDHVLRDALDISHRLYVSKVHNGFKQSGKCNSIKKLSKYFDPMNDPLSEVKAIASIVSDLNCFQNEFRDIIRSFEEIHLEEDELTVDKALDMMGKVMKFLYRFKMDGTQFGLAAEKMDNKVLAMYQTMNFNPSLVKRLFSKMIANHRD